jgi:hypothetical protein
MGIEHEHGHEHGHGQRDMPGDDRAHLVGPHLRCWQTGVALSPHDARRLDLRRAGALYRELSQRLVWLEELLADLGRPAGDGERARALGLPPRAPRLLSAAAAEAHALRLAAPEVFVTLLDSRRREDDADQRRVAASRRLAPALTRLGAAERERAVHAARLLRASLPAPLARVLRDTDTDLGLALSWLLARKRGSSRTRCHDGPPSFRRWLAAADVDGVLGAMGFPPHVRRAAALALEGGRRRRTGR